MVKRRCAMRCTLLYLAVCVLCLTLLYAAGLLPQEPIARHLKESAPQFQAEGEYPYLLDQYDSTFRLDAFSESLILNHSYYLDTRTDPLSVISNPCYRNGLHPVQCLLAVADAPETAPNSLRSRYWMGFRAVVRPLLCLYSYQDIRSVLQIAFFSLLFIAMLCLQREAGSMVSLCLGLTALAMNPVVVSTSLQFSCCFLLAFAGVIAVCRKKLAGRNVLSIFLLLGQLTQYFDFYTSPLITWGLPFVALVAIRRERQCLTFREGLRLLGASAAMWAGGYVGMWVLKMLLTTLLTAEDGFRTFQHFLYYTGLTPASEGVRVFSIGEAVKLCLQGALINTNRLALYVFAGALAARGLWRARRASVQPADSSIWLYAVIAALPLIWLACSKQASGRHAYFQYRTLAVMVFAGLCFLVQCVRFSPRASGGDSAALPPRDGG